MTGPLENPVNVDPLSQTANVSVWTGTLPGGIGVPGADHCKDWLSELDSGEGTWGRSSEVDEVWLQWPEPDFNPTLCGVGSRALYCVEQP
jgi:hypothetical protein